MSSSWSSGPAGHEEHWPWDSNSSEQEGDCKLLFADGTRWTGRAPLIPVTSERQTKAKTPVVPAGRQER